MVVELDQIGFDTIDDDIEFSIFYSKRNSGKRHGTHDRRYRRSAKVLSRRQEGLQDPWPRILPTRSHQVAVAIA